MMLSRILLGIEHGNWIAILTKDPCQKIKLTKILNSIKIFLSAICQLQYTIVVVCKTLVNAKIFAVFVQDYRWSVFTS